MVAQNSLLLKNTAKNPNPAMRGAGQNQYAPLPRTRRANPGQEYLVIFHHEPIGDGLSLVQGAPGKFKNTVAGMTVEVMMMRFSASFIQHAEAGMADLRKPPVFDQKLEIAINRGLVQGTDNGAPFIKDFFNPQWPVLLQKDLFYGGSLGCYSFHLPCLVLSQHSQCDALMQTILR
jgi:hypothetical protein